MKRRDSSRKTNDTGIVFTRECVSCGSYQHPVGVKCKLATDKLRADETPAAAFLKIHENAKKNNRASALNAPCIEEVKSVSRRRVVLHNGSRPLNEVVDQDRPRSCNKNQTLATAAVHTTTIPVC